VDHTGIDVVAYKRGRGRLGIAVRSRTRVGGQESSSVTLFNHGKDDRAKVKKACTVFACKPWIAVYVEAKDHADLYLTSLQHCDRKYRGRGDRAIDDWKMNRERRDGYASDPNVSHIRFTFAGSGSGGILGGRDEPD
jgi:hypothetical protein